jgi:flagellar hook assembly protein FlgD
VLTIHDAAGRLVRRLVDGPCAVGTQSVQWDGRIEDGGVAPAGVYFARLQANGVTRTGKLVLVK